MIRRYRLTASTLAPREKFREKHYPFARTPSNFHSNAERSSPHWQTIDRMFASRSGKINSSFNRDFSRADLQGEPNEGPRRGEARKGEHILPSGRESAGGTISLDLQQFRREYRRGRWTYSQSRHILDRLVHAHDRIGLRHVALLGDQSNWTSTSALRLSHHTGR